MTAIKYNTQTSTTSCASSLYRFSTTHNAHSTIMQKRRRLLNDDVENCVEDIVDQIEEEHRATLAWIKEHDMYA